MAAVSLADAKLFLGITDTADDDELTAMLGRAEAVLTARVGPLEPVTVTDEKHTGPGPIVLKRWPVLSVSTASTGYGEVTDLDLDVDAGVLYGTFSSAIRRDVTVTYQAGRYPLPADLEAAVLELLRHLWSSQRVPGTRRAFAGDPDERTLQGVSTYLLPYRVQTLIEPHLVPRLA